MLPCWSCVSASTTPAQLTSHKMRRPLCCHTSKSLWYHRPLLQVLHVVPLCIHCAKETLGKRTNCLQTTVAGCSTRQESCLWLMCQRHCCEVLCTHRAVDINAAMAVAIMTVSFALTALCGTYVWNRLSDRYTQQHMQDRDVLLMSSGRRSAVSEKRKLGQAVYLFCCCCCCSTMSKNNNDNDNDNDNNDNK